MKNIKHLKIGRSVSRIPVARPGDYVYERPEVVRASLPERLVAAFQKYRPDIDVKKKWPGVVFGQYGIKILPGEAHFSGLVHPFETTTELLENLNESGIISLTRADIAYIGKYCDKN